MPPPAVEQEQFGACGRCLAISSDAGVIREFLMVVPKVQFEERQGSIECSPMRLSFSETPA
jgi:hypothetical protein